MNLDSLFDCVDEHVEEAIKSFWTGRDDQLKKQLESGKKDQGSRGAATGGKHFDGMLLLLSTFLQASGVPPASIFANKRLQIPGFYRPTKKWDLLVVHKGQLLVVVETKAIVGSFGNNLNNRSEEALGNATDLWRAQRDEAFNSPTPPWLGFLFIIEDNVKSRTPVACSEPHYAVLPEFKGASYIERSRLLCRKLMAERQYSNTAFITTKKDFSYEEPDPELCMESFLRAMIGHVQGHIRR